MIDTDKLRRLAQAVSEQINCNQVWIDQDEDVRTVMVGYIGEGGDVYHVVSINPYYAEGQSLPLGKFYAAANPATVLELLDRLEVAEKERDVLRDRLALESQENGALRDSVDRACEERDELRAELKEVRYGVAVAHDTIKALRAKIEAMEKRLRLILEEPENTLSNSKALRECIRQAKLALEESK